MRVKDIMTGPVHVIWRNAPIESAAKLMADAAVTALPVVRADGGLAGMVSESDLLWHRMRPDPAAGSHRHPDPEPGYRPVRVAEVMSERPLTTTPEADVAEVADTMLHRDVRSLPVLRDGLLVGMVSRRDVLRAVLPAR